MSTSTDVSKHGGIRPRLQADCRHTESPQSASADWSSRLFKIKDLPSDRAGWRGFLRGRAEWFGLLRGIGGAAACAKPRSYYPIEALPPSASACGFKRIAPVIAFPPAIRQSACRPDWVAPSASQPVSSATQFDSRV